MIGVLFAVLTGVRVKERKLKICVLRYLMNLLLIRPTDVRFEAVAGTGENGYPGQGVAGRVCGRGLYYIVVTERLKSWL